MQDTHTKTAQRTLGLGPDVAERLCLAGAASCTPLSSAESVKPLEGGTLPS